MSKHTFLFIQLVFVALFSNAQAVQRNILAHKYSPQEITNQLIPKNDWNPYPKSADEWRSLSPDSTIQRIIGDAEEYLDYEFPSISATVSLDFVRSGDRTRHGSISYTKRNVLIQLVLAESMEGKNRFTEQIMNGIWSICEESYWGVPAHIRNTGLPDIENPYVDLFAAETAALLGTADYFTGEKLDAINPLIRKRIYKETNERVFTPMLTTSSGYGYMSRTNAPNNWNPWIMSNWIMSTLLLENNESRRAEMLHSALVCLDAYLNGLGEDGGCDEGPSYWFAAGASVYECLELLYKATRNLPTVYDDDLIKKMLTYVYKTHIAGSYFTNFADADPKLRPDGLLLFRIGNAVNDPQMIGFGQWAFKNFPAASTVITGHHRMRRIENLLTINSINDKQYSYKPVADSWISDIQVMTARGNKGIYLAAHGGHNAESHNHNDVGDFIIYKDGEPLIIDAGRGNYTARTFSAERYDLWFTQSNYHNLPIINGVGQQAGRQFESANVSYVTNAKVAMLNLDIAKSYPAEAGVSKWMRKIALNKKSNFIEVSDSYELEKIDDLKQIFMTVANVDIKEPGKIKIKANETTKLTIIYDPGLWNVTTEYPSTDGMEYSSFKTKWDGKPVQRIILQHKALSKKGSAKFLFTF